MNWNDWEEEHNKKTRDLPIYEYFEALQKEYVVMEIRSKIHSRDRQYYYDIMSHKEDRIKDIGRRNNLPTMFDDINMQIHIESMIIKKRGMPHFLYRDERAKAKFAYKDIKCYYALGSEVKVHLSEDDKDFEIGTIEGFDIDRMNVSVRLKGGKELVSSHNNVTRIL